MAKPQSRLLCELIGDIPEQLRPMLQAYLARVSLPAAAANDSTNLFPEASAPPALKRCLAERRAIEKSLQDHLKEVRKVLGKSQIDYTSKGGTDWLIEVRNEEKRAVP